jgi:hypothetical protein
MFSFFKMLDEDNSCELSARRFGSKFLGDLEVSGAEHQVIHSFDNSNDFIIKVKQVHSTQKVTKTCKHLNKSCSAELKAI